MAVIRRYLSEFDNFRGALCKSSRSLSHLLMSSCFQSIIIATLRSRCRRSILSLLFLVLSSLFLVYSQRPQIGWLPCFHTWRGLSANLGCRSEMCCTRWYFYTAWKGNPSSQVWLFVQLCSSWQDFNWLKASRGPSAIAELLVVFILKITISPESIISLWFCAVDEADRLSVFSAI